MIEISPSLSLSPFVSTSTSFTFRLSSSSQIAKSFKCSFAQPRLSCEASRSPLFSIYTVRVHNTSDRHHRPHPSGISARTVLFFFSFLFSGRWAPNLDLFGLEIFCLVGISLYSFYPPLLRCCSQQSDRPKGEEKSTEKIRARSSISPQFGTCNADLDFISI